MGAHGPAPILAHIFKCIKYAAITVIDTILVGLAEYAPVKPLDHPLHSIGTALDVDVLKVKR